MQKSVGIPVMDVPVLFSDKFLQSKEFELIVPQIQFIFRVWGHSSCMRRARTVQPVQRAGDPTVMVQLCRAVDMPVVVQREAPGCTQCRPLLSSTAAVLWRLGRRHSGGVEGGSRCFQARGRSSSHR